MDNIEIDILKMVSDGPLPIHTSEAKKVAPLNRFGELEDAGLIEAAVIREGGQVVKLRILGITLEGRDRLNAGLAEVQARSLVGRASGVASKLGWVIVGVGGTLVAQWLSRLLGLTGSQ